jgi:hypothetical protein
MTVEDDSLDITPRVILPIAPAGFDRYIVCAFQGHSRWTLQLSELGEKFESGVQANG